MHKSRNRNLTLNWILIFLVALFGFLTVTFLLYKFNMYHLTNSREQFEDIYIDQLKLEVKTEVDNRIEEIYYDLEQIQDDYLSEIKNRIIQFEMIQNKEEYNHLNDFEKREFIISQLKEYDLFDDQYLYFMIDTNGVLLKSGVDEAMVGSDLIDVKSLDGIYYVKEMVTAKNYPDGIFVTYEWPKEKGGAALEKTSFCLYLEEFDVIVGTGIYFEDVQDKLKYESLIRIEEYYKDDIKYIFVIEYDGTAKVFADKSLIGESVAEILDSKGTNVHELIMNEINTDGDGYVTYFYKKNEDEHIEKITYVRAFDPWGSYLGMGFYTDDLTESIDEYSNNFIKDIWLNSLVVMGVLGLTIICVYLLARRGMKLQTDLLKQEEIVFEQLFQTSNDGLLIISKKNKVLFINNFLEHILDGKNVIDDQGNINLENEKDDVYTFENEETKFYFDISYESIIYRSVDSLIYFFKDVTKPYLETHHLEKMALLDELTGLSNRRKLINDTAKTCDDQFSFAMLDIDYFKEVNDQYGHDRGDDILKLLSKVFTKRLRSNDDIYRFGGDEFIVLLRGTKVEKAKEILEELNTTFSNEAIDKYGIKVTFTAGIISIDEGGKSCDVHEYIKQVDKVLYRGKEKGRNRIEIEG